jgi:pyruvate formate lyase activating enzyme
MVSLPPFPPKKAKKSRLRCNLCINECELQNDETSYCGLRNLHKDQNGQLPLPSKSMGYIQGYTDPNPTNCCNAWICPAGTEMGYPIFSDIKGPEYNTYSYAAFLYGCSFNCLFCQNWSHKFIRKSNLIDVTSIVQSIVNNENITCLCFFGGTPEPQLPFTINLSDSLLAEIKKRDSNRKFRICWEWNGSGNHQMVEKCMKIAINTGGNIKFDLKAFEEKLHIALCGKSNSRTLENFKSLAEHYFGSRQDLPELSACTLLVPGYINHEEVEKISLFISEINENIPYSLLIFHPDYQMKDLPITPRNETLKCLKVAKRHLKKVNLGNSFLLARS